MAEVQQRRRRRVQQQPPSVAVTTEQPQATAAPNAQGSELADTSLNGDAMRGDMRPPLREETDRERAARVAKEIFDHEAPIGDFVDKFPMPAGGPPDGWHYEWKRDSVYGARNPSYSVALATQGWRPVPASRHPEFMPVGSGNEAIEREGLILMEIPKVVAEKRAERAHKIAKEQVNVKNAQLTGSGPGQFERHNKGTSMVSVSREYAPIAVPGNPAKT